MVPFIITIKEISFYLYLIRGCRQVLELLECLLCRISVFNGPIELKTLYRYVRDLTDRNHHDKIQILFIYLGCPTLKGFLQMDHFPTRSLTRVHTEVSSKGNGTRESLLICVTLSCRFQSLYVLLMSLYHFLLIINYRVSFIHLS